MPYQVEEHNLIAALTRPSFFEFVREFWSTVVAEPFIYNWHIEYICGELQKAAERVFRWMPKTHDLVINVPPGSSKPVWEESMILMADGTYQKLKSIQIGDQVIGKSGKPCTVKAVHVQGKLPTLTISTAYGRNITTALDHPILTAEGWKITSEIKESDHLALLHKPLIVNNTSRKDEEFVLAGYFIGDGHVVGNACNFTNQTPEYLNHFKDCASKMGFSWKEYRVESKDTKSWTTSIRLKKGDETENSAYVEPSSPGRGHMTRRWGPRDWLRDIGLADKNSKNKRIPDFVWKGTNKQIALFLAAYFHCDGHAERKGFQVSMTTISKGLVKDLQRLFLRVGVSLRIRKNVAKKGFNYNRNLINYVSYSLSTYEHDLNAVARFSERIPITGYKRETIKNASRIRFEEEYLPDPVRAIYDSGDLSCRCLSVEGDESFVVDGVVVHNSTICSQMFPAWVWTNMPNAKFICASYSHNLSLKDSVRTRDVVMSELYQKCFPEIQLREDENTKGLFVNTRKGMRLSVGVNGTITGFHAHFLIVDDPLSPEQAFSDADLKKANRWMEATLPTRKVDKEVAVQILVQQRLHQADPTGEALEKAEIAGTQSSMLHICLPGELTPEAHVSPPHLRDKYVDGLFDPRRLSRATLEETRRNVGEYAYASQIMQDPVPLSGAMFETDKITIEDNIPAMVRIARSWDKAGTEGAGAYTAGVKMGVDAKGDFWILNVKRKQLSNRRREVMMRNTAEEDGKDIPILLEIEGGSGGKESAEESVRNLAGWRVIIDHPTGDKVTRAYPLSSQVGAGNVHMVRGVWNRDLIEEFRYFPNSKYKDQVDASSQAFAFLARKQLRIGAW